jgi:8-oxo-dGTP pyrophosphatase MutT (NUDIX family)
MQQRRRIGAYGVCRDAAGRVLLVRAAHDGSTSGRWNLPGGGIDHGEHPVDAVVREMREETGLDVEVVGLLDVVTDLDVLADLPAVRHYDRIIFDVVAVAGVLRDEENGTSDRARFVGLAEAAELPMMPFVAGLLGLPIPIARTSPDLSVTVAPPIGRSHQRFAVYGLATDAAGNVLLTRIADGFPGAGLWHLPGGGTDFGESAVTALERELREETDQVGQIGDLLDVSHRHQPDALGPEGVPIDWHGVRVVYRVLVGHATEPRVVEDHGGSTVAAAWFPPHKALGLPLTEIARDMITGYVTGRP